MRYVAFDCFPHPPADATPAASYESKLVRSVSRLMGREDLRVSATSVQVPAFAGEGSALSVTTRDTVDAQDVARWFESAPGLHVASEGEVASTRETVGSAEVGVARLRSDTSALDPDRCLQMWLSADPIRQAAENAVALMRARLSVH